MAPLGRDPAACDPEHHMFVWSDSPEQQGQPRICALVNPDPQVGGALDAAGFDVFSCPCESIILPCASRPRQRRLMLSCHFFLKRVVFTSEPHGHVCRPLLRDINSYAHVPLLNGTRIIQESSMYQVSQVSTCRILVRWVSVCFFFAGVCCSSAGWTSQRKAPLCTRSSHVGGRLSGLQLCSCRGGCPCLK